MNTPANPTPPGVSVVIPAYNYARFLPAAIDSVLAQDYPNLELLVVDDGSTDATQEVCRPYGDRIRYIYQTNAGLSAARNTGIREARFEFIAFLDADDAWEVTKLTRQMDVFVSMPPEFGVVATGRRNISGTGALLLDYKGERRGSHEVNLRDLLVRSRFVPSSVVARRTCFDRSGGFDTTLRSSEDRDMWIRIAAHFRLYWLNEPLTLYRRHDSSMSRHADRMKANTGRVLQSAWSRGDVPPHCLLFWAKVRSFHRFQCAWMYAEEGRHGRAIASIVESVLRYPFFLDPKDLNEPFLFRLRAARRFLWMRWFPESQMPESGA